jgi:ammonia channel protein AmtB
VIIYKLATLLLFKLKIDDPLDAAPVHGFCGMWGALAPGTTMAFNFSYHECHSPIQLASLFKITITL